MNDLVTQKTQLPAHLAHLASNVALMGTNAAAAAGVSSGGWPRISLKSSRFRLQHPQGEEVVVNALDLDVIIVDANPNGLSKTFYTGAYDPSVDEKAPDCYSDNGVGPSARAAKPQASNCATCPHNIWGSKINPSGNQGKMCGDSKKVAVLIADNPDGPVFELRIPAASLKNWANYIESLNNRGIPAAAIVTRLNFDAAADFPKLLFAASGWANEAQAAAVMDVIGTEEVDLCTGKNDKPVAANTALAAPAPALVAIAPSLPPLPTATTALPAAPLPAPVNIPLPPAPVVPVAAATIMPPSPVAAVPVEAPAAKRTRKAKVSVENAPPIAAAGDIMPPLPVAAAPVAAIPPLPIAAAMPPLPPALPTAAALAAPLTAPVTNSALDDLIAQAMKV